MKHAPPAALDRLEDLLERLRAIAGLREKRRGIFYRKGTAFLHFHDDRAGLFADLRTAGDWQRMPVNTPAEGQRLLQAVQGAIEAGS